MFTGLIEEVGIVSSIRRVAGGLSITVGARLVMDDLRVGDSVSVNGACLTATDVQRDSFTADVVAETEQRTTFPRMRPTQRVNLERAVRADARLGGHLVAGHIDGVGQVLSTARSATSMLVDVAPPAALMPFIVDKGSIAIDGVSLTIARIADTWFRVSVIPHTAGVTTIGDLSPGTEVNLEADMIVKYVARLLDVHGSGAPGRPVLTEDALRKLGF